MFRPLQTDQGRNNKARAYFMLAAGGRVVRSHHHPDASNSNKRLMVPTEKELKTILYDQTGARVMAHNRRENIDYVALHANRRPRRATRMGEGCDREGRQVAGRATTESPCRDRASTNPHRRLAPNPSKGTCVEHHRLVGTGDNSPQQNKMDVDDLHPCPRSAEEDAPVSVFLDSFSAFGVATADTVQGMEVTPDSRPTRQEHAPGKPTHRAEATASTEAAYELSEPLAQVDVYSILSKAPPAEIRNGMSRTEVAGNPQLPKRGKNERVRGSVHRAENVGSGEQRLTEAEPTLKIAYLARDPLGDEVAELNAKLQENARRLRQEAAKQQPPRATDIARQAALLTEKMRQPPNADSSASCGNANANPPLRTTKSDGTTTTQGLDRHGDGAVQPDRRRRKRGFVSTTKTPTALPHRAGTTRGWMGSPDEGGFTTRQTCRGKPMELSLENGGNNAESEENAPGMGAGGVFEARIGFDNFSSFEREAGKSVPETEGRKVADSRPRRRKGPERKEEGDAQLHEGESLFQPGGRTKIGVEPLAATLVAASDNGVSNKEHYGSDSIGAGDSRGFSCSGGSAVGVLGEDAAALRIESCWRGFLGRCAAKHELRSVLLDALRKIGGGKISKAMALGDVAEGDRHQLNHALRTATQSRRPLRQLPAQAHILECARFVAAFQSRHAKAVDARKRRWVAEREQRKGIERARARVRCGLLKPVPTAKTCRLRFAQA